MVTTKRSPMKMILFYEHFALFIIIFGLFTVSLNAATIELLSGEVLQGSIMKKTDQYLEVIVQGKKRKIELDEVKSIQGKTLSLTFPEEEGNISGTGEQTLFEDALQKAAYGKFDQAEKLFQSLLKSNPSHQGVFQAINIIKDYRNHTISKRYATNLFQGAYSFINKEYKKAIQAYEEILEENPESIEVYYNLAKAYQFIGEHEKAIPLLKKLLEIHAADTDVLAKLGVAYYSLGEHEQAIKYWEQFIAIIPDDPDSYSFLGVSYYSIGDFVLGKAYLRKAKKLFEKKGLFQQAQDIENLLDDLL